MISFIPACFVAATTVNILIPFEDVTLVALLSFGCEMFSSTIEKVGDVCLKNLDNSLGKNIYSTENMYIFSNINFFLIILNMTIFLLKLSLSSYRTLENFIQKSNEVKSELFCQDERLRFLRS